MKASARLLSTFYYFACPGSFYPSCSIQFKNKQGKTPEEWPQCQPLAGKPVDSGRQYDNMNDVSTRSDKMQIWCCGSGTQTYSQYFDWHLKIAMIDFKQIFVDLILLKFTGYGFILKLGVKIFRKNAVQRWD